MKGITEITDIIIGCTSYETVMIEYTTVAVPTPRIAVIDASLAFSLCCRVDNLGGAELLAKHYGSDLDVGINGSAALRWACQCGHLAIVQHLYANHRDRLDVGAFSNYALRLSCQNGHMDVVKFLLDIWIEGTDISAQNCAPFRKSCRHGHYDIALLLVSRYQAIINSCDTVFTDGLTFPSVCRNHWAVITGLLLNGLKAALSTKAIGSLDKTFKAICNQQPDMVHDLITTVTPPLRNYLANTALQHSYTHGHYAVCTMIIDCIGTSITPTSINRLFGDYSIHKDDEGHTERHRIQEQLVHKFKSVITSETYENALAVAGINACERSLNAFALDLGDKITPEACDRALRRIQNAQRSATRHNDLAPDELFIQTFRTKLTAPTCQDIFRVACYRTDSSMIAVCLNHVRDKLDLSIMTDSVLHQCLRGSSDTAASIIRAYRDRIDAPTANYLIINQWSESSMVRALIENCRDKIDAHAALFGAILDVSQRLDYYPPDVHQSLLDPLKLLLTEFGTAIDHTITAMLLGLDPNAMYYLLSVAGIIQLINTYRHEDTVAQAVAALDQGHPNTRYVLASLISKS